MKSAFVALLVLASAAWGAEQIGTVTGQGVTLRGQPAPGAAQNLPLTSGDEIATGAQPATLELADKSVITLEPNTRTWAEVQNGRMVICLSQGSLQFRAAPGARISICALGRPVELEPLSEGVVVIEGADKVRATASKGAVRVVEGATCGCVAMPAAQKKGWTTKKVAVVTGVAGGAAAGTAIGLAVGGEPAPVSPSKP